MSGCPGLVLKQIGCLAARHVDCDLFAERLDAAAVREAGGRPVRMRRLPGARYWSRRSFAHRVQRRVARGPYDLVIGHGDLLQQDCLFIHNPIELEREMLDTAARIAGNPVVRFHREMFQRNGFRLLIANSQLVSRDLQQRYGIGADEIRVVYPGYDARRFNREQRVTKRPLIRERLGVGGEFLLAFVTSGNFPMRGADILVETVAGLPAALRRDLRVLVVGSSTNLEMMRRLFADRQLETLLICRGKTVDVQDYYHAADLLFHPARLEPFGLVIVEAIGCGTPVLTSRRCGAAELLPSAGVTDEPLAADFADRLASLMTDPLARQELIAGQQATAAGRTDEAWCRDWMQCLAELDILPARLRAEPA